MERSVLLKVLRSVVSNGLALLGAWGLLQVVKTLIQGRAPGSVDWSIRASAGAEGRTVAELVRQNLGHTVELLVAALVVAALLAAAHMALFWRSSRPESGGVLRAVRSLWLDFWMSASPFYLNFMMLFVFAIWLGVLPSGSAPRDAGLATRLYHLLLPALALAIVPAMLLTSKGLREMEARQSFTAGRPRRLLLAHLALFMGAEALRMVGLLLALAAFVEGRSISASLLAAAAWAQDAPVVVGLAWVLAVMVVVSRLLADMVHIGDEQLLQRVGVAGGAPSDQERPSRRVASIPLWMGLVVFGGLGVLALFSPWTAGYNPLAASLRDRMLSPSLSHLLGTDYVGRDLFSRLVHGLRFELLIALIVLGGAAVFSAPWSALVVWLRGKSGWPWQLGHEAAMWPIHVLTAFPWTALAALVIVYNYGVPGVESRGQAGDISMYIAVLLLLLVPRGVKMCVECFDATSTSLRLHQRAVASAAVLVPMVTAAAIFLSVTMSGPSMGFLGLAAPRPSLGNISMEMRDYLGTTAWVTKVVVPLVGVLLVASLLWMGEYLQDRMRMQSGSIWSRGLE
ncbi:MAG: hypothetical protein Q8O40_10060 [Chloroflexota bacterium]|nr:hypothetical protein [Chloroflexota bacterium]